MFAVRIGVSDDAIKSKNLVSAGEILDVLLDFGKVQAVEFVDIGKVGHLKSDQHTRGKPFELCLFKTKPCLLSSKREAMGRASTIGTTCVS